MVPGWCRDSVWCGEAGDGDRNANVNVNGYGKWLRLVSRAYGTRYVDGVMTNDRTRLSCRNKTLHA